MGEGSGAYEELQTRCKTAEKAVLAAQQHFQAVTAGLSSGADGQEETLAGQKIGMCNERILHIFCTVPPHFLSVSNIQLY